MPVAMFVRKDSVMQPGRLFRTASMSVLFAHELGGNVTFIAAF